MNIEDAESAEAGIVKKTINVVSLTDPRFLTLVKYPGGQVAFKVVRKDDGNAPAEPVTEEVEVVQPQRIRRVRSVVRSSLLSIVYPAEVTDEDAEKDMATMGLTGYTMSRQEDGSILILRSDLSAVPENTFRVDLGDSRFATILRSDSAPATKDCGPTGLTLVALDFKMEQFADEGAVLDFLSRNSVTYIEDGITRGDGIIRVSCSNVPPDTEIRTIEIDGVTASVARSDIGTLSGEPGFTSVINDAAFGCWGWGQLDFSARLADVKFSEAGREATGLLYDTLQDVLFYNSLPVTVRKELVVRTVNQFSLYMVSLLEALPEKLVVINRSSVQEKEDMSKESTVATAAGPGTITPSESPVAEAPITRTEIKEIVDAALAAFAATQKTTDDVQRKDETATPAIEVEPAATPEAPAESVAAVVEAAIQRSMAALTDTLEGMNGRLKAMEGSTVVRSDGPDSTPKPAVAADPFAGIFGTRLSRTPR
jgi:hypothetical protein